MIVFDGGMKASRKICGACKSGIKEFENTNIKIETGCTNHPAPGETMCKDHKGTESPALPASRLSKETLQILNAEHVDSDSAALHDTLFVIEEINGKKNMEKDTFYKIKWEGYKQETWEPSKNIPVFIKNFYERTGRSKIPSPYVKHTKQIGTMSINLITIRFLSAIGTAKLHLLFWEDKEGVHDVYWEMEEAFSVDGEIPVFSCNTQKDKDKRKCRHSFGILIGN